MSINEHPCNIHDSYNLFNYLDSHNYSRLVPPPTNGGPLEVSVGLMFLSFFRVNEIDGTVKASVMMFRRWQDPRMILNCSSAITIAGGEIAEHIYIPPVTIAGPLESHKPEAPEELQRLYLKPGGYLDMRSHMILTYGCITNFTTFPFDKMSCIFYVSVHSISDPIRLSWIKDISGVFDKIRVLSSHIVVSMSLSNSDLAIFPDGRAVSSLICTVVFAREYTHYICQGFLPHAITVLVAWLGFFVDPNQAPARVTLGISSLIAMVLQYGNVSQGVPKIGYVTCMDLWMLACILFIFCTLAEFAVISLIGQKNFTYTEETNEIRDPHRNTVMEYHFKKLKIREYQGREWKQSLISSIDFWARVLYPTIFLTFSFVFFVFIMYIEGMLTEKKKAVSYD